jgi:hypothetical protein
MQAKTLPQPWVEFQRSPGNWRPIPRGGIFLLSHGGELGVGSSSQVRQPQAKKLA